MAREQPLFSLSYTAAKDLSSYQYEAVRLTTANEITNVTSATAPIVGVLQNNPTSGQTGRVMAVGVSKVKAGGAFGRGVKIKVNAVATSVAGRFVAGTTNADSNYRAYSQEAAGASGDIVTAVINFSG